MARFALSAMARARPTTTALCGGAKPSVGRAHGSDRCGLRWRHPEDRQHFHPDALAGCDPKKGGRNPCLGRFRGGLTTEVLALVDKAGLPVRLALGAVRRTMHRPHSSCSTDRRRASSCWATRSMMRTPPLPHRGAGHGTQHLGKSNRKWKHWSRRPSTSDAS